MQRFAVEIKGPVWSKLKIIFSKYSDGTQHMAVTRLEDLCKEVLREETPAEIDYVIKNINRIDKDNNGTIQFEEFGNFLLKRHCGEMALQKMHRCNEIQNGHIRKVNKEEFGKLLNSAYEFLAVQVDERVFSEIFQNIDKDKDGLITYAEYFGFTDAYLLDTKPLAEKKKPQIQKIQVIPKKTIEVVQPVKEFQSRLRNFLMSQLRRIFQTYDKDVNSLLDAEEMKLLLMELFGLNADEINNVLNTYFRPDINNAFQSYPTFVSNFLNYASDRGWFIVGNDLNPRGRTNFNLSEFHRLIEESFRHLNIGRVNKILFQNFFRLIDKNQDGLIEISEFKNWIFEFLAPPRYAKTEFYLREDDESSPFSKGMILDPPLKVDYSPARSIEQPRKSIKLSEVRFQSKTERVQEKSKQKRPSSHLRDSQISVLSNRSGRQIVCKFTFSSHELAQRVRKQMMIILAKLDKNHNLQFEEAQIIQALQILMKATKHEVQYVIANVFRYDRNEDNIVTYEELANFFLEIHFGQIAIQRLHKQDSYIRGSERIMNLQEFVKTLDYALSFIQIETYEGEAQTLFKEIDLNRDGWITYQEYFEFLIHYFGTESVVAQVERRNRIRTMNDLISNKGQQISPEERFSRLIRTQIKVLFVQYDKNKNIKFERQQALQIARQVLNQTDEQATKMITSVFGNNTQNVDYDFLVNKFLDVHSSQVIILRLHRQGLLKYYRQKSLDLQDFMALINSAFVNISILPTRKQYAQIFERIDSSDKITYRQYQHFIARYLGKSEDRSFNTVFEQPSKLTQYVRKSLSNSPQQSRQKSIASQLFLNLRSFYEKYDRNNQGIERSQFEQFIKQAFKGTKKQNINHILWAVYRVDQNMDGKINLIQSIPFILRLQAQLTLHNFHRNSNILQNKQRLSNQDFFSVIKSCYPFCETLQREALSLVFQGLDTDSDGYISDIDFISWIGSIGRQCANQN